MQCQHLWMKSGTSKKRRYIPIDPVFNKLPSGYASSLLAFHTLTGCDTTSYIENHIKRSPWKIFKEHHGLLNNLGIGELTDDTIVNSLQKHLSAEYTICTESTLSMQHGNCCSPRQGNEKQWPPTSYALHFHFKRVHYQSMIWRNAHCPTPELPAPSEMGCILVD